MAEAEAQIGPHGYPCECPPTRKRGERCTKQWMRCSKAVAAAQPDLERHEQRRARRTA